MTATRQFIPPFAIETRYNKSATGSPSTQAFTSYVVPVQPGVSLTSACWLAAFVHACISCESAQVGSTSKTIAFNIYFFPLSKTCFSCSILSSAVFRFATLPPNPPPSDSADASAPPSTSPPPQKSIGGMLFSLAGKLPHWLFMAMELSDQDTIIMHQQVRT